MTSLPGIQGWRPAMLTWVLPPALLVALMLAAWPLSVGADEPPSKHEVSSGLMCQCGCGMTVATCQEAMSCAIADTIVQEISVQIDEGKTKGEILDSFVSVYGEDILSVPRKSGFSLMAWVAPFLAVVAGAVVASAFIWYWARRRPAATIAAESVAQPADLGLYEQRVDEDLSLLE